ncbi:hypothetical protein [Streptomyces sp. NPDC005827]|uniref:hypothetical protein n=1 Tax=Streptomyces sp. NPDC005827 TaxID=3157070 RepID=UPI0033C54B66
MGVFARLLGRKPKATEEPDAETPAGTEPDGSEAASTAEEAAAEATAAKGTDEGDDGSAEAAAVATEPEPAAVTVVASTEIPRQQSAKEAADNEAGEGART